MSIHSLMRLARWFWRRHKENPVKGGPQALRGSQAHSEMSYYDTVPPNLALNHDVPEGLQGHIGYVVDDAVSRGAVKINERGIGTGDGRQLANNVGDYLSQQRSWLGYINHNSSSLVEVDGRLYRIVPGHIEPVGDK